MLITEKPVNLHPPGTHVQVYKVRGVPCNLTVKEKYDTAKRGNCSVLTIQVSGITSKLPTPEHC
jgi:hypothetical protein